MKKQQPPTSFFNVGTLNLFCLMAVKKITQIIKSIGFFLKKIFTAIEIIFFILKYFLTKFFYFLCFKIIDSSFRVETRSLCLVIFFSFFFYYFIVVELSISIFGYSLLCYRFLFILLSTCLIFAWQLEVEFIWNQMKYVIGADYDLWIAFYKNKSPLSFFDYITDYRDWPLFWLLIVDKLRTDLEENRLSLFIYFTFFTFFFFYTCSYWFDPRIVDFVAKYFHPAINFFETWWAPRREDFLSAIVRFWNRLFIYLEAKRKKSPTILKLKKLTRPNPWLENWANVQWAYKISLWKSLQFGDIYFLRVLSGARPLWRLVFSGEQPIIMATRFDPNWKIFFLWFVANKFTDTKDNYWTNYFAENPQFWKFINSYKDQITKEAVRLDEEIITAYEKRQIYDSTSYELFLSMNYFNNTSLNSRPNYEWFGTKRDFLKTIANKSKVVKQKNLYLLKEYFTSSASHVTPFTLSGLLKHNSKDGKTFIFPSQIQQNLSKNITGASQFLSYLKNSTIDEFQQTLWHDFDLPLYNFSNFELMLLKNPATLKLLFSRPISNDKLLVLYNRYHYWLSALENVLGRREIGVGFWTDEYVNADLLFELIKARVEWLDIIVNNKNFSEYAITYIPTLENFKYYYRRFFKLSVLARLFQSQATIEANAQKEKELKERKSKTQKPRYVMISEDALNNLISLETKLQQLERSTGLWISKTVNTANLDLNKSQIFSKKIYPWYIWSLQYFGFLDYRFVLPGFVWYYSPTPFPTVFSSFGQIWNKYQYFWQNSTFSTVGYSDSIAELRHSTPLALYSGVEAIMYVKPILHLFDYIIKFVVNLITYPIEWIVTQNLVALLTTTFSLSIFAHFLWFIHFYIYLFIFIYLLFYFFIYYYKKIGFLWFYEWTFEELTLIQYNNRVFWHTVTDLWTNYKSPEQLFQLAVHTNLLLHYTFFNYANFYLFQNKRSNSIFFLFNNLILNKFFFINYLDFIQTVDPRKKIFNKDFFVFWSFFNVKILNYTPLLYTGGPDAAPDQLIWTYFSYLEQSAHFYSWALCLNHYDIHSNSTINSLIKQMTILFAASAPSSNFLFLSQPLLDSLLARKLLSSFLSFFILENTSNLKFFTENFLYSIAGNKSILKHIFLLDFNLELYNSQVVSGLNIYDFFSLNNSSLLNGRNVTSFWNDKKYWILAFFWSFWFINKFWFPGTTLHLAYEDTWLHLSRIAYSNSWILQSTYTRPFFNLVQHLWFTARIYSSASSLLATQIHINQPGLQILDNVRNFFEKRYSKSTSVKVETVFGVVWSLDLTPTYNQSILGTIPFENKNFDLSYSKQVIDKKTTNRSYLKTNPVLDVSELNITPLEIFKLFRSLPIAYSNLYLTFFHQLKLMNQDSAYAFWDIEEEFKKLSIFEGNTMEAEHEIYSKYEFYLKKFDFLLRFSKNSPLKNLIFGFDVSYFFSHFLAPDFYTTERSTELTVNHYWKNNLFNDNETWSLFFSNFDFNALYNSTDDWFEKPFGLLDKFELQAMKKFKILKQLDTRSFSSAREDPFLNLDKESTVTDVGFAHYPKIDDWTLDDSYSEEFAGSREWWFPRNPVIQKNANQTFLLGFVGHLLMLTNFSSNFLYSLMYASPQLDVNAWWIKNDTALFSLFSENGFQNIESFFGWSLYQQQLLSRAFSTISLALHPVSFWYSFGPKAAARIDYWSWKTGICQDYTNGLYSFWPYIAFWHSLLNWMLSYDPMHGFYASYRQIHDDPLTVDLSTDIYDQVKASQDEMLFADNSPEEPEVYDEDGRRKILDDEYELIQQIALPYREIYYSFQHPYFIGYVLFCFLLISSENFYLGMANFSSKRYIVRQLLLNNVNENLHFDFLITLWNSIENRNRWAMFKYRRYFFNPIYLLSSADCIIDDEILQNIDMANSFYKFYLSQLFLFDFMRNYMKLSFSEIHFSLDFKKTYTYAFKINWLGLDLPFFLNPYIVFNNFKFLNSDSSLVQLYNFQTFSLSRMNTLHESLNFNLFYDWSSGIFLDNINFTSYFGTFWGSGIISDIFYENPSFIAANFIWYEWDWSLEIANSIARKPMSFLYSDIILSYDLALHNLSLLKFFQDAIAFLVNFEIEFYENKNLIDFLNFYFKKNYLLEYTKYSFRRIPDEVESKIIKPSIKKFYWIKQFMLLFFFQSKLTHDVLLGFLNTGVMLHNRKLVNIFFKSFKLRLTTRYLLSYKYYKWVFQSISLLFFKK